MLKKLNFEVLKGSMNIIFNIIMSRINYKKFQWVEKKSIELPLEIILLLIDCFFDTLTACTFLRTNKFWYNCDDEPYYLCNPYDDSYIENPANYVLVRHMKPEHRLQRKIVKLHDYYCCQLYLDFYSNKLSNTDFTFFGYITNAPLELFVLAKITHFGYKPSLVSPMTGTITTYNSCKKIQFDNPIVCRCLHLFLSKDKLEAINSLFGVFPYSESEYVNGRRPEFEINGIDVIHTTNQNFCIKNNTYFISCITSSAVFKSWNL